LKSGLAIVAAAGITAIAVGQIASAASPAKVRAGALQAVVDCRKLTDGAERLACFDAAAAKLDAAEQAGDVVVVDRAQVKEAQRAAFGFNFKMPSFLGGGGGDDDKAEVRSAELDTLDTTAQSVRVGPDRKWIFRLPDGAIWMQTDTEVIARAPKAGSRIEIRKGTMGGYFLSVDGQKAVRAKRQN